MSRVRSPFVVAALFLMTSVARAELDAEERPWVAQCIEKLQAKSERVRSGAEDALVAAGPDVIDLLVAKSSRPDDVWWTALERIAMRIGRSRSAKRLTDLAAAQKDAARRRRCEALVARLDPPAPGAQIDPQLAAKVESILLPLVGANSFVSDAPEVGELRALGHGVVPILVAWCRSRNDDLASVSACCEALVGVAEPADVPLIASAMSGANGIGRLARPLGALVAKGSREALAALHDEIGRGGMSFDLAHAIENSPDPVASARVLAEWLRTQTAPAEHEIAAAASAAEALGVQSVAPLLAAKLPTAKDEQTIRRLALALTALGDPVGVPVLLRIVAGESAGRAPESWARAQAARRCAEISGIDDRIPETSDHAASGEADKQFRALAAKYREWWNGVKDRIRFDAVTRRWVVPG